MTTSNTTTLAPATTTTDIGLLILRLATGATILQAGLIKAFDFGTAVGFMESEDRRLPMPSPRRRCCSPAPARCR